MKIKRILNKSNDYFALVFIPSIILYRIGIKKFEYKLTIMWLVWSIEIDFK